MSSYYPDGWQFIKIEHSGNVLIKVFGSWLGSFTEGEHWRLNSGCTKIETEEDTLLAYGYSGSVYFLDRSTEGKLGSWNESQLQSIIDSYQGVHKIERISAEEAILLISGEENGS